LKGLMMASIFFMRALTSSLGNEVVLS
jgi:hypothetical protein